MDLQPAREHRPVLLIYKSWPIGYTGRKGKVMKTWAINCKVSMTYEVDAETEAEAQEKAAEIFAVDMVDFDIETETE